jgi:hypothetical protein
MILDLYKDSLAKITAFVKSHFYDIMLFIIVAFLVLLAFAAGYITAKYQSKDQVQIINPLNNGK